MEYYKVLQNVIQENDIRTLKKILKIRTPKYKLGTVLLAGLATRHWLTELHFDWLLENHCLGRQCPPPLWCWQLCLHLSHRVVELLGPARHSCLLNIQELGQPGILKSAMLGQCILKNMANATNRSFLKKKLLEPVYPCMIAPAPQRIYYLDGSINAQSFPGNNDYFRDGDMT